MARTASGREIGHVIGLRVLSKSWTSLVVRELLRLRCNVAGRAWYNVHVCLQVCVYTPRQASTYNTTARTRARTYDDHTWTGTQARRTDALPLRRDVHEGGEPRAWAFRPYSCSPPRASVRAHTHTSPTVGVSYTTRVHGSLFSAKFSTCIYFSARFFY